MSEPDEHIIEVWVRNPQSLSASVRVEVARRIRKYPEWRETADYWKEYYATLAETPVADPDATTRTRSPLKLVRFAAEAGSSDEPTSLAAKAPSGQRAVEELATFVHADPEILVRFLHDTDRGLILVRTVSASGVVAAIQVLGEPDEIPLDARGGAEIVSTASLITALQGDDPSLTVILRD